MYVHIHELLLSVLSAMLLVECRFIACYFYSKISFECELEEVHAKICNLEDECFHSLIWTMKLILSTLVTCGEAAKSYCHQRSSRRVCSIFFLRMCFTFESELEISVFI